MNSHLIYTHHAEEMLAERRIQRAWVEQTIRSPDVIETDRDRPEVIRAFRRIPECEGRVLRAAYVVAGETVRVVTVFFDTKALTHRQRRQRIYVGDDIHHHRPIGREGALQRRGKLTRFFHADAERADLFGQAREVDHLVGP